MAKDVIKYLVEANRERKEAIYHLTTDSDLPEALAKENDFLNLLNELAETPIVESSLVSIIKDTKTDEDIRKMACLIAFTIDDKELWNKIFKYFSSEKIMMMSMISQDVISLLEEKRQEKIIKLILTEVKHEKKYNLVGDTIYKTGYLNLADNYINRDGLIEIEDIPETAQQIQAMLALNNHPQAMSLLEDDFFNRSNYEKESMSYEMVLARSNTGFEYIKENALNNNDIFGYLTRFGGQQDYKIIQDAVTHNDNWLNYKGHMDELFWYGNPQMMQWFYENLSHPESEVRFNFHRLMLDFFDEESELRVAGEELLYYDEDEGDKPTSPKQYKDFWRAHKQTMNETLNPEKRYYGSTLFDMNKIWEYEKYSSRRSFTRDRCTNIMIWTGKYFAYDEHALITKQLKQHDVIAEWLAENHDKVEPGRWMRWGKCL